MAGCRRSAPDRDSSCWRGGPARGGSPMASGGVEGASRAVEPGRSAVGAATRWPFARTGPIEADEWLFVERMGATWLPMHHTLFQTIGRAFGLLLGGDSYGGLVILDMAVSALALASLWWWLRALVRP